MRFRAGCVDDVGGFGFFKDYDAARLTPCKEDDAEKDKTATTDTRHEWKRICGIFPGRYQPSIVSASELNCRVRDEQRLRPPPVADTGSKGWRRGRKNRGSATAR